MALDPNIILGIKGPEFASQLDMAAKAMSLKDMASQGQLRGLQLASAQRQADDEQAIRNAYKSNLTTGPNGQVSVNRAGVLSTLTRSNPEKAVELNTKFNADELDEMAKNTAFKKTLAWSIKDADTYAEARQTGIKLGLPNAESLPQQYDPSFVKQMQMRTLSAEEQVKAMQKDREFDLKKEENGIKRQDLGLKLGDVRMAKNDKLAKDFKNDMDADKGRSGNFGLISGKVQSAERLDTLIKSSANGDLPPAQMEELSLGLATMLAGSSGTSRAQVEALVPHTWTGQQANIAQWLTSNPKGAGQQKFVEFMAHTIDREKQTAIDQLNQIRAQRLSAHKLYQRNDPEGYKAQLQGYKLDPSRIVDGVYKPASDQPASKPASVIQNGHTYNLNVATGEYE